MSILAECPYCHVKQSNKNKKCSCGANLDKEKKYKKVNYWISYRINKKQKREKVSPNLSEAQAAEGKRKAQKYENPSILEKITSTKITFGELSEWYLGLASTMALAYYKDLKNNLNSFNQIFGETLIVGISPEDLREYQLKRIKEGYSDSYIDKHIGATRTMMNRAFENNKISGNDHGDALKAFRPVKRLLKNSRANARKKILSHKEFLSLMKHLPIHLKPIVSTGYHTGMRIDEILSLTWDKVNIKKRFIYLEVPDTKDKEERAIPINKNLLKYFKKIPQGLHNNYVFLYRGEPIKDIRTGLIRACKKSGIIYGQKIKNGFIFHDLRHTFNTNMRKAGVAESVIMEITGHVTREMFDRYNTVDETDMKQGVNKLDDFLQSVDQNVDQDISNKQKGPQEKP